MALFEELPVYKVSFELLRMSYRLSQKMERTYRYTLGESLQKDCKDLMLHIYRANCEPDKGTSLAKARELVVVVQLLIRVAHAERAIDQPGYLKESDMVQSLGRQLTAWHKSVVAKQTTGK